jgi:cysteine sulfinate desulfinase/cysteine desulfurase-like protein
MGLSPEIIDSAVRISFSRYNTPEEVGLLVSAVTEAATKYGKKR